MKMHIALLATTAALASAMQASLVKRFPDATFTNIKKLNERPAGSTVASLGLPSFVPGSEGVKILSFGSRILDNTATEQERANQWNTLRSKTASTEEVLAELGNFEEYVVLKGRVINEAKLTVADIKLRMVDATSDEERAALAQEGFQILSKLLA